MSASDSQVVLFVDLLGVRSKWLKDGREGAERAFKRFRTMVASSIHRSGAEKVIHGLVESDAVALTFSEVQPALEVAKRMYTAAFEDVGRRVWLRGCIVRHNDKDELRTAKTFGGPLSQVQLMLYSAALLDAISVEKSGFKGMRLLVERQLITPAVRNAAKQPMGHLNFIPLTKLRNSTYPKRLEETFVDYLWMGTTDRDRFKELGKMMAVRLRMAANEPEEFAQAGATQVVFHECAAILSSVGGKVHYRELKNARAKIGTSTSTETKGDGGQ
ncbi:MAG: hypothetical protein ABSH14_01960 [Verrucomicrobiia bacterium]